MSSFVGRESECAELRSQLQSTRLLSLTGPPGCGKSRLAVEVAALPDFEGRVWQINVASIKSPAALTARIAAVRRGLRAVRAEKHEQGKEQGEALLLLDNCDTLLPQCAEATQKLLRRCRLWRVLATSQRALGVPGEHVWPVRPLSLPDEHAGLSELIECAPVRLFVDRARAVDPSFRLDGRLAGPIAALCRRLDGLPLALEVAAALVSVVPVQEIAERVAVPEQVDSQPPEAAVPLHAFASAIAASYGRLSHTQQRLFARLSVFNEGFTLASLLAVCGGESNVASTKDGVYDLVAASLVQAPTGTGSPRFHIPETLRRHAASHLSRTEGEELRRNHAAHFLALAGAELTHLTGAEPEQGLAWYRAERANLDAAYVWSVVDGGDTDIGAGLAARLWPFWYADGALEVARERLETAIKQQRGGAVDVLGTLLAGAALVALRRSDPRGASAYAERLLSLPQGAASSADRAWAFHALGTSALEMDDLGGAHAALASGLAAWQEAGEPLGIGRSLVELGLLSALTGDCEEGQRFCEEGMRVLREQRVTQGAAWALANVGVVALVRGEPEEADRLCTESLNTLWRIGFRPGIPENLVALAAVSVQGARPLRAAFLLGAARALSTSFGAPLPRIFRLVSDRVLARLHPLLDARTLETTLDEGAAADLSEVVALALDRPQAELRRDPGWGLRGSPSGAMFARNLRPSESIGGSGTLTAREREILRLVAAGASNKAAAKQLVVSVHTIERHLANIYAKLGLHRRSDLAQFVSTHPVFDVAG